jgi:hypothetical protein
MCFILDTEKITLFPVGVSPRGIFFLYSPFSSMMHCLGETVGWTDSSLFYICISFLR